MLANLNLVDTNVWYDFFFNHGRWEGILGWHIGLAIMFITGFWLGHVHHRW